VAGLERAVADGDLAWHALPFTTHTEVADRSLLEHGLTLSAGLDDRFGRRTRAAKLTDVPGHTRGLVPVLASAGVDFLHVGVNPAAPAPDVPERFRWRDDAAQRMPGEPAPEVTVMYQAGGYGSMQVLGSGSDAVLVEMTSDNLGPPSAADVATAWALMAGFFPGAEIRAATLDDVANLMRTDRPDLPVVTSEIGDTWIHGVASDPLKLAGLRELTRRRAGWIGRGEVGVDHPALRRASTELLLAAEHTWGLDQKTWWPDTDHWSAPGLASVRPRPDTQRFESSWVEQRAYLDRFVQVLRDGGLSTLADDAARGLAAVAPGPVDVVGLTARHQLLGLHLGPYLVDVDRHDGALVGLRRTDGAVLADPEHPVGRLRHRTYDADDYERWFATYNAGTTAEDQDWARWDNTKPGLERSGARSAWYTPSLVGAWSGRRATGGTGRAGCSVLVLELHFTDVVRETSAAPPWVLVEYVVDDDEPEVLHCRLHWVAKDAARWPESTWWCFRPLVAGAEHWRMTKLGERVDPREVVSRGARSLHAVESVVHEPSGVRLDLLDPALVAPGEAALLRFEDRVPDLEGGWQVCLYDNVWGTNFPMWCPGDATFRIDLHWS
jgi:hypothetical protein